MQERLDSQVRTRRLFQLEVVNIAEPVTVYQLAGPQHADWAGLKERYEQALAHYEQQQFRDAARILGELLAQPQHRDDGPALVLLQRTVSCLVDAPKVFSPVWKLADKGK